MNIGEAVEEFITHKRAEGFIYHGQATQLRAFGKRVGETELHEIQSEQIASFLDRSMICRMTWRMKYALIARFFRYWQMMGYTREVPMPPPRGFIRGTFVPYVYSSSELRSLMQAASQIPQNQNSMIHPETFRTLLLFLYATGARISEAFGLRVEDLDLEARVMRVRLFGRGIVRTLPIGVDLSRILRRYTKWKRVMQLEGEFVLARRDCSRLNQYGVHLLFNKAVKQAGIVRHDHPMCRPRMQDFRSTFAVHRINSWIRQRADLNRLLPALSAYLGQTDLGGTQQFLQLTPERFRNELDRLSPLKGKPWSSNPETMKFLASL